MTLLHFHSHHPLSCKKGNIYSQALRYNMIISEDHILQEELNNVARILLARAYPLHLIIKSIKKPWPTTQLPVIPTNTTDRNQHSPIVTPFSDIAKLTAANNIRIGTPLPFVYLNPYRSSSSQAAFTTILSILHEDMAPNGRICNNATHTHRIYQYRHTVMYPADITTVVTLFSSSIPDTPN